MQKWIITWAQAHADMSLLNKRKDYTARLTVFNHVNGGKIRIRLSNRCGKAKTDILGVSVMINREQPLPMKFKGQAKVSLQAGESIYSDDLAEAVKEGDTITVSLAFAGGAVSGNCMPENVRCSAKGDFTKSVHMPVAKQGVMMRINQVNPVLPILSGIEVFTEEEKRVIVCFGDSITQMCRWAKPLAERIAYTDKDAVVINEGIAGNQLMSDPLIKFLNMYGMAAVSRFGEDALEIPGVTDVIIALGVNDLNMVKDKKTLQEKNAAYLLKGLEDLGKQAKERGLRVYVATVTPPGGCSGYRSFIEPERRKLNQLIRKSRAFDGILDFDALLRDPEHPERMFEPYNSGDHLHPGISGGQVLADAVYAALWNSDR